MLLFGKFSPVLDFINFTNYSESVVILCLEEEDEHEFGAGEAIVFF